MNRVFRFVQTRALWVLDAYNTYYTARAGLFITITSSFFHLYYISQENFLYPTPLVMPLTKWLSNRKFIYIHFCVATTTKTITPKEK